MALSADIYRDDAIISKITLEIPWASSFAEHNTRDDKCKQFGLPSPLS